LDFSNTESPFWKKAGEASMKVVPTEIPAVLLIEPAVFQDSRGFFLETYRHDKYHRFGIETKFVQDNLSYSRKNVLRGLHFQWPNPQAKLVQVLEGAVFDVAVDIRRGSPTFGKSTGQILSSENKRQLFIPEGFAHGFFTISDTALFMYKCSDYYNPSAEKGILFSDPHIHIKWPEGRPILSDKDAQHPLLKDLPETHLPEIRLT
jgi:dTDP-4-dehydrorhamnose 3,5-epimerase